MSVAYILVHLPERLDMRALTVVLLALRSFVSTPDALFTIRNGFWINLHHFLYAEALAKSTSANPRWVSTAKEAIQKAPCSEFDSPASAATWDTVVQFYASHYASRDMLFDSDFVHINDVLGDSGDAPHAPSAVPADLRGALEKAAPVYRNSCWLRHRQQNQVWIDSLESLLEVHGARIAARLTRIYETQWPVGPLPVDVVIYADWAGAYTAPPHITIGSVQDTLGSAQLETIFHESLHTMDRRMVQDLTAAFDRHHSPPYDLDHVIIFFTAGVVTQQVLGASDPKFAPYAYRHGLYKRVPHWDQDEAALRKYWKPFLDGRVSRQGALDRLTHAICCE